MDRVRQYSYDVWLGIDGKINFKYNPTTIKTKVLLFFCLLSGTGTINLPAQTLDHNAIVHIENTNTYLITLQPGVTMNQYIDFLKNKYIPGYDKNFPGSRMTVSSSDFREGKNQYSAVFFFESLKARDKYFPNGTGLSDTGKAALEKMKPLSLEVREYVLESKRVKTDWMISLNEVTIK